MRGQNIEGAGDRTVVDHGRFANANPAHLLHHVHRQREKNGTGGGGVRIVEGAAKQNRKLVGVNNFLGPFHGRTSDLHQVAQQQWICDRVTGVLLPGGHH